MPIDSCLDHGVFGPEAIAVMSEAFAAACKEIPVADQSNELRELVATLIVAAARRGELDPVRLRTAAVAGFAIAKCPPEHGAPGVARVAS